ncbi:MAG: PAS domain-containing protein [Sideroxyarcus sp.]
MTTECKVCGKGTVSVSQAAPGSITFGICAACVTQVSDTPDSRAVLEAIHAPILLLHGNPRQVVSANKMALRLFGKEMYEVAGYRGGQVFDCIHSFTEAGCGKDENCENCKIKNAIVNTFTTGESHNGVATALQIKKPDGIKECIMQVSTERAGDLALVRVERFDSEA